MQQSQGQPDGGPGANSHFAEFVDAGTDTSALYGFAWDPEAYWFTYGYCMAFFAMQGQQCPMPPFLSQGVPAYDRALVQGAGVQIFDPAAGHPVASATNPSGSDGSWTVAAVPSRNSPPFLAAAMGGALVPPEQLPVPVPPPPPSNYAPTITFRPIATNYSSCYFQQTALISQNGVLEAVAKYLTSKGTPTAAADLVDPSKYAGVAVWWLYQPGNPLMVAPAFGTTMHTNTGTAFNIDWAPPGMGPPTQSNRGYFVADQAASPIGLTVITVKPSEYQGPVTFTPFDPVTDPSQGRPWGYGPLTLPVIPGMVAFGPLMIYPMGPPPPSDPETSTSPSSDHPWLCLPKSQ